MYNLLTKHWYWYTVDQVSLLVQQKSHHLLIVMQYHWFLAIAVDVSWLTVKLAFACCHVALIRENCVCIKVHKCSWYSLLQMLVFNDVCVCQWGEWVSTHICSYDKVFGSTRLVSFICSQPHNVPFTGIIWYIPGTHRQQVYCIFFKEFNVYLALCGYFSSILITCIT